MMFENILKRAGKVVESNMKILIYWRLLQNVDISLTFALGLVLHEKSSEKPD